MARKPARMYREIEGQAYTRREYMGGVPNLRISQFDVGNTKGTFDYRITLTVDEACQVRDNALEAARISANRIMGKTGPQSYRIKILKYPHNVLREHKMATGAGADRVSGGMRAAFGKAVGSAARMKINGSLISIYTNKPHVIAAKRALVKAGTKIPSPTRVSVEQIAN